MPRADEDIFAVWSLLELKDHAGSRFYLCQLTPLSVSQFEIGRQGETTGEGVYRMREVTPATLSNFHRPITRPGYPVAENDHRWSFLG